VGGNRPGGEPSRGRNDQDWGRNVQGAKPSETSKWRNVHKSIQGLPNIFGYPLLSQERVKLRTSNFVRTFIGSIGTKAHWIMLPTWRINFFIKNFGKSGPGRSQGHPEIFRPSIYRVHRAVSFAIAQLSCLHLCCQHSHVASLQAIHTPCGGNWSKVTFTATLWPSFYCLLNIILYVFLKISHYSNL